ncbi:MAG: glycosyltransferase family 2 protein [Planctomycetes bacterium]|nr:glycosyltransferase family 2 protein [Planctomycetota bacterium]
MSESTVEVSVVTPVHNEEPNVPLLGTALATSLSRCAARWEVLWVDDASVDGSLAALRQLRRSDGRNRVLHLDDRRGQSAAFWCGFRNARFRVIVTIDADLQNDPDDIPLLLNALEGCDLAMGERVDRKDPWIKRVASQIGNAVRNRITGENVADVGCSLKAFRREVVEAMFPFDGMHRFYPTLAKMAGFRVATIPVRHHPRQFGRTKYGVMDRLVGPLADCLAIRWMKARRLRHLSFEELDDE